MSSIVTPTPGSIPKTMKAIRFNAIRDWELTEVPVPELRPGDVLVKMKVSSQPVALSDWLRSSGQ